MVSNYRGRALSLEPIRELSRCEVFVFGSNLEGKHRGGAAGYACRHFGAVYGQGSGPQGQCYAIPTMFSSVKEMVPYVQEFVEYVKEHPMNRFLITRLGCGIAGFTDKQVAPLFYDLRNVNNAVFDLEWWLVFWDIDMRLGEEEEEFPNPTYGIDEKELVRLSGMFRYEIGAALNNNVPYIGLRYVDEKDLLKRFMAMWPMIKTEYVPIDPTESVSLNDADELTGRFITAFIYRSDKHEVSSWKEMLVRLCTVLHHERKADIEYLCQKNEWWLYTKQESNWRTEFAKDCWVSTQNDTQTKRKIIQHIFTECNIPETDLYFLLKPVSDTQNEED